MRKAFRCQDIERCSSTSLGNHLRVLLIQSFKFDHCHCHVGCNVVVILIHFTTGCFFTGFDNLAVEMGEADQGIAVISSGIASGHTANYVIGSARGRTLPPLDVGRLQ